MVHCIDLEFLGRRAVIAAGVVTGPRSAVIVDPGPASSLETLRTALAARDVGVEDLEAVLLTHVHLDHSGCVGVLVRERPHLEVYVHERGAPHVIDPSKLLASAGRLYQGGMDSLWGEVPAVPASNVRVLAGGERLQVAGRTVEVAYTPGHASHHVSYFDHETRTAFVGDTAGIRLPGRQHVLPPTPPPDIDLEAWFESIDVIEGWKPAQIFLTHFGPFTDSEAHLERMRTQLGRVSEFARMTLKEPAADDEQRKARFREMMLADVRTELPDPVASEPYETAVSSDHSWLGLARYWRKRGVY
jgi:glyoxylase-like metal-dependent hydrolase (beta-lactamase superfamily II)